MGKRKRIETENNYGAQKLEHIELSNLRQC